MLVTTMRRRRRIELALEGLNEITLSQRASPWEWPELQTQNEVDSGKVQGLCHLCTLY